MYPLSITDPIIETIVKSYNYRKDDTSDGNYKWMPKSPLRPGEEKYTQSD
ncbi:MULTISPECIES: hypothetical protein [Candidatus Kuenenia]|jgi:hypothetical protein|uniref:Uncharacterized protein n=1 Tax=Kuenenia stuttgartiensis TaxID=174633 RepID=A0A2C9CEK6_KUEST|nr:MULTISPECIES: hypothetical protein [Kuenenia]MCZ7622357.1 hypothetical protein [Candidatus Kuenenia sp.]SOH03177.1 hypothetical protein KSMBR1_0663 [Candidatus Kuenenia stuttgartiensis]